MLLFLRYSLYQVNNNPSTIPIDVPVKVTSDVVLLSLYCTSYCVMIPLGVSGGIHDNDTDVDWRVFVDNERGADGSKKGVTMI